MLLTTPSVLDSCLFWGIRALFSQDRQFSPGCYSCRSKDPLESTHSRPQYACCELLIVIFPQQFWELRPASNKQLLIKSLMLKQKYLVLS